MTKRTKRLILLHIVIFTVCAAYVLIMHFSGINCPFRYITGYPCPTCGTTRSLVSLLKFDFEGYMHYQPMAVPLLFSVFCGFHFNKKKKSRLVTGIFISVIAVATLSLYIFRIATHSMI